MMTPDEKTLNYNNLTEDRDLAAALMTFGFMPRIVASMDALSGRENIHFQIHQKSFTHPEMWSSTMLKRQLHNPDPKAGVPPLEDTHPFRIAYNACAARTALEERMAHPYKFSALPGTSSRSASIRTGDRRLSAALSAIGYHLQRIEGAGSSAAMVHDVTSSMLPERSSTLIPQLRQGILHKQSEDHLLLIAYAATKHRTNLIAEVKKTGYKIHFNPDGDPRKKKRSAIVTENAHGDLMEKAEKLIAR